jgi:hypothetical protein
MNPAFANTQGFNQDSSTVNACEGVNASRWMTFGHSPSRANRGISLRICPLNSQVLKFQTVHIHNLKSLLHFHAKRRIQCGGSKRAFARQGVWPKVIQRVAFTPSRLDGIILVHIYAQELVSILPNIVENFFDRTSDGWL